MKFIHRFESYSNNEISFKMSGDKYYAYNQQIELGYIQIRLIKPSHYSIEYAYIEPDLRNKGYGSKIFKAFLNSFNVEYISAHVYSKQSLFSLLKAFGEPTYVQDEEFKLETLKRFTSYLNDEISENFIEDFYIVVEWLFN